MDLSTAHDSARTEASRLPALTASLALLAENTQRATIALYGTARPAPGADAGGAPIVTLALAAAAGSLDPETHRLTLTVPQEAEVTGAAEPDGTDALWARITDGSGAWWADASVSETAGAGEITLPDVTLRNGAFCRLTEAVFQG